ncbi:hypothetical protein AKJ09_00433 [Labilithrix luteola]|uniref:Uncharacterized protein n=1 Tax=Labilithrix luteola TaxID=1391654 RepID=A0A0K1PKZ2_9BACT|nr:hypothetical protein [Labilithrix luteola]AKU93769.1 hypothetical protein AKJ09_00433 [Labilithrix luteola]
MFKARLTSSVFNNIFSSAFLAALVATSAGCSSDPETTSSDPTGADAGGTRTR